MATLPKWTDERTEELTNFIGDESPVSQDTLQKQQSSLRLLQGQFLVN